MDELVIREARPEEAAAIISFLRERLAEPEISSEPEIVGPLTPEEFTLTVEEEAELLAWYAETDNAAFFLALYDGEIVGELNLKGGRLAAMRHSAFLGMSVARDWRGRGVGQRLLNHAIRWARENPVLTRIELGVYTTNAPALHIYKKAGFEVEGLRRRKFLHGDRYYDDYCMAIYLGE